MPKIHARPAFQVDDVTLELMHMFAPAPPKGDDATPNDFACASCGHEGLDRMDGRLFCAECGLTRGTAIDATVEWRSLSSFKGKGDDGRCGLPTNPLLPHTSMQMIIVGGGNTFMKKLHRWTSSDHRESARIRIFAGLRHAASRHGVSAAVVHQAQSYVAAACNRMVERDAVLRAARRRGLFAACLFFAFKKLGCPRSVTETASIFEIDAGCVSGGIKAFGDLLSDNPIVTGDEQTDAHTLLARFAASLGLPANVEALASRAVRRGRSVLQNHIPEAQAAAAIWYVVQACGLGKRHSKKQVAAACGVSDVTVSKCCAKLDAAWRTK